MVTIEIEVNDERVKRFGVILGVFIAVGLGLGATSFISMVAFSGDGLGSFVSGVLGLFGLVLVFFLGPAVAGAVAFISTIDEGSGAWAITTGALGSMIGFYLMVILVVVLVAAGTAAVAEANQPQQQQQQQPQIDGSGSSLDYSYYQTTEPSQNSSRGLGIDFGELVMPTLVAGIPTALSGGIAGYLGPVLQRL